jgi:hypothetical protein
LDHLCDIPVAFHKKNHEKIKGIGIFSYRRSDEGLLDEPQDGRDGREQSIRSPGRKQMGKDAGRTKVLQELRVVQRGQISELEHPVSWRISIERQRGISP